MVKKLEVFSDMSERVHYNVPGLPLYSFRDDLWRYGYTSACHWHPDLEFILALSGSMRYSVNGHVETIESGHAIFVNSRRLHFGYSDTRTDCTFISTVIHPSVFTGGAEAGRAYFDAKTGESASDFIMLGPHEPWQREVIGEIQRLNGLMRSCAIASTPPANTSTRSDKARLQVRPAPDDEIELTGPPVPAGGVPPSALFGGSPVESAGGPADGAADGSPAVKPLGSDASPAGPATPLDLIASASRIASIMLAHVGLEAAHPRNDPDWMAFWSMTRFIYYHYGERLTIEDIARAGLVGRSACYELFDRFAGTPPTAYLNRFRISTRAPLLEESDGTVGEIAVKCGYGTASYFIHAFRKQTGMTPQQYRRFRRRAADGVEA